MNRPKWLILLVALSVLVFALGACSDDDEDDGPAATDVVEPLPTDADMMDDDMDSESPLQIEVVSQSLSFSPDVIEAPEAVEVTIVYENAQDGVQHNFAIYATEEDATDGGDPIAATDVAQGPDTQDLAIGALPAGDYFVWCQVHTALMTATLRIE